jgi:hypothetical protein
MNGQSPGLSGGHLQHELLHNRIELGVHFDDNEREILVREHVTLVQELGFDSCCEPRLLPLRQDLVVT